MNTKSVKDVAPEGLREQGQIVKTTQTWV